MIVGCYVRVSTENQIENYSIDEQFQRLKAYCIAKDYTIHKIYTDAGFSGGNLDRPGLNLLLEDIKHKKIQAVVVYKLDRLSRSQKDTLTLIEDKLLANNVEFISMSENFDTSSPFGRAMIGILSVFAQLEKDQITERFTMGRIGRGKAGLYHGGPTPPTGYLYVNGELIVDELKALQIKEVFEKFLSGLSVNAIRRYMHNTYGGWNSHTLVLKVLRNSVYIGNVKFAGVAYEGKHQPIISQDAFKQVQDLLNSVQRQNMKNTAQKTPFRAGYLLSGLIYCDKCKAKYSAVHGYYKCYSRSKSSKKFIKDPNCKNEHWDIEELDRIVTDEIIKLRRDNVYFNSVTKTNEDTSTVNRERICVKIKEIDKQIRRMVDLYQMGNLPIEEISRRIEKLQLEKDSLEKQIILTQLNPNRQKDQMQTSLKQSEKTLTHGTLEEKRMLISSLIERVIIAGTKVNLEWRV